jgi:hypothetical protein
MILVFRLVDVMRALNFPILFFMEMKNLFLEEKEPKFKKKWTHRLVFDHQRKKWLRT